MVKINFVLILQLFFLVFSNWSCEKTKPYGFLNIVAENSGKYEIYQFVKKRGLDIVGEYRGQFNKPLKLEVANYLIFADCSYKKISLTANETKTFVLNTVNFTLPFNSTGSDNFKIQCNRYSESPSKQNIQGRFKLHVFNGNWKALIGLSSIDINFKKDNTVSLIPQTLNIPLNAIKVRNSIKTANEFYYYIYSKDSLVPITTAQKFDFWKFLLPGKYQLELNGTTKDLNLSVSNRSLVLDVSYLKVVTPKKTTSSAFMDITGSPNYVSVNKNYKINYNNTYPIFPNTLNLNLDGSLREATILAEPKKTNIIKVNSIQINSPCLLVQLDCRGRQGVSLYLNNNINSFQNSVSDVPIYYFPDKLSKIWVMLDGSREVKRLIPNKKTNQMFIGKVKIVPVINKSVTVVTDLLRIRSKDNNIKSYTLDINLTKPSILPFITGTYRIENFISIKAQEGLRKQKNISFIVRKNITKIIEVQTYFTDKI